MTRACQDCAGPISAVSKGRCRRCSALLHNQNPERRAKAAASMKERFKDPSYKAAHVARVQVGIDRAMQDPEFVARKRASGLKYGAPNIVKTRGEESRAKAGRSISAVKLKHIPERFRDEYRGLVAKGLTMAERTMIIEWRVAEEKREARRIVDRHVSDQAERAAREKAQAY